jgi:hypothetical protein
MFEIAALRGVDVDTLQLPLHHAMPGNQSLLIAIPAARQK